MLFPEPLVEGVLIRRYKRFLADIELDGETILAHCANPGAMTGLDAPGSRVWLSANRNPKAKLDWRWELVCADGVMVGINTAHPNTIVAGALAQGQVGELAGYADIRREVRYGAKSRVDFLLEDDKRPPCYLEVKNVHLKRNDIPGSGPGDNPGVAEFPDAVTKRGARHLEELAAMVQEGARSVMLYLVQRGDCDSFRLAADIDPVYAETFKRAQDAGVEAFCYDCRVTTEGIEVSRALPIET